MTLRLSAEDDRVVSELAKAEGISKLKATVRAIHQAALRRGHKSRIRELSAHHSTPKRLPSWSRLSVTTPSSMETSGWAGSPRSSGDGLAHQLKDLSMPFGVLGQPTDLGRGSMLGDPDSVRRHIELLPDHLGRQPGGPKDQDCPHAVG